MHKRMRALDNIVYHLHDHLKNVGKCTSNCNLFVFRIFYWFI